MTATTPTPTSTKEAPGPASAPTTGTSPGSDSSIDDPLAPAEMTAWNAYKRIFSYASPADKAIQAAALFAAVASGAGIAAQNLIFGEFITVITRFAVGGVPVPAFRATVSELALYFVYLGIARFVLSYAYNTLLTWAAYRVVRNIRHAYLRAALRQEVAYYDFGTGGSVAAQATSNGRLILGGISEKLGLTFQGLGAFVTAFIIAFAVQWKLTLICLCIPPLTIGVTGWVAALGAKIEADVLGIHGQANAFAESVLSSVRTTHAFEMRERLVARFDSYLIDAHAVGRKLSPLWSVLFSTEYTVIYLGFGLAFWQGVTMLARGEITETGAIFTVLLSVVIASVNLTIIAPNALDFGRAAAAAAQLFVLIDRESSIDPLLHDHGAQPDQDNVKGHIELRGVTFAYPTRPGVTVLDDFTLDVPAGKVTALVGQSGSGKSTIVGLLERWYNPGSGSLSLDGIPIQDLNLHWLRRNIRLVQQEPVLFQGSVFDNINHGLIGTPFENESRDERLLRVQNAARMAFAHDFITELPDGYDTHIGQRGSLLSGGQKQRVAIARSIVSEPKVLLLDEATSALDPHAEAVVQAALDRASEGRTTIVIAHKLATVRKADNIVVMTKGRIVEQGTHEALITTDGAYARLVKAQDLAVKAAGDGAVEAGADSDDNTTDKKVDGDDAGDDNLARRTLTRYPTGVRNAMEDSTARDDYERHGQRGIVAMVYMLYAESPEIGWSQAGVAFGCVIGAMLIPGQAILMASVVDVFTLPPDEMVSRGSFFASMFIVLAAGCTIGYGFLGYCANTVAQHLSHKYRKRFLADTLRQDLQFFDRPENNTGALVSRLDSNPQSILELMGYNVSLIFVAVLQLAICSILAIAYSWRLGLCIIGAGIPPLMLAGFFKIRLDAKLDRDNSQRYGASAAIASEAINAIRTVSSLAIEESVLAQYVAELDAAVAKSLRPTLLLMVCFGLTQCLEYWFMGLGYWYGCQLLSDGTITMTEFFVAFLAVFYAAQASAQLFMFSTSVTKGVNAANYMNWLRALQPTITEKGMPDTPVDVSGIQLDKVRFSYPMRPDAQVLRGVDLDVDKGQFVALVGASGCGKSTMIAMLERFYDPTTGVIRLGGGGEQGAEGTSLTDVNPRLYRRQVALVQQEPTLFPGSIRDNISLGVDRTASASAAADTTATEKQSQVLEVTDVEIETALRAANAWDFVSSLPDGLATPAGNSGSQLSGGQRQRIAIARALIRDPRVLLLDEATSALDTESEKIVQAALAEAAKGEGQTGRITVAVAHRLSTIKDADVICVFYHGKIVEMGSHRELVELGGMYRKMCEAQALD